MPRIPPYFCSELPPSHCQLPLSPSWMPSWRCPSLLTPVWSPHLLKQTPMMPMTPPNWRTMPLPFLRILHGFPTLSRSFRMSSLRKLTSLLHWPVFQFRKTPLHRQGDPVENTGNFTCDPRQHESTECGFHHFSGVSGIFQLLCVGLRTRKSMAFVLNSPWLEICLAGPPQFFNFPAQLFVLNFSIPFGIPSYNGGRVIKHLITLATASQNGHSLFLPVLNGTDTRTENVSQLLFVDFHCSFHGQKQRKETTEAQKFVFSTCRFLSFQGVF
ncbi:hypothetical protein AC96_1690 [Escherichia coli 2-156-04_S4_C2]|nr:hypothetical protein L912_4263 [Escherichia coli SCD1]KDX31828.1 hypothetical protein AC96_1690 [Escherichia coli 2-156-04_S4_C2]